MNSIFVISPYKQNGMWVFDDPARDLVQEPFVAGADDVIELATQGIPDAERGFNLVFADFPFPGHQIELKMVKPDAAEPEGDLIGTTYFCEQLGLEAWLCPALNKYYPVSPESIFAQFRPMVGRINQKKDTYERNEEAGAEVLA